MNDVTQAPVLDPSAAARMLGRHLPLLGDRAVSVPEVKVLKVRSGRRAVIAYSVDAGPPGKQEEGGAGTRRHYLVGKVRARGLDRKSYRVQKALSHRGFDPGSSDGISVPPTLGLIPSWRMWVQRRVAGQPLDRSLSRLPRSRALDLMGQVALGIHKLHRAGVPTTRTHTLRDELGILMDSLEPARAARPKLDTAITRVLEGCRRLASRLKRREAVGIHRDFHPGQLLVEGERLHLLDLDLYAMGDAALDVGNFTAHLTELAIRETGDPAGFESMERALREVYLGLAHDICEADLRAWHLLGLARHIGLSVSRPGRDHTTEALVDHCSAELSARGALPSTPGRTGGLTSPRSAVGAVLLSLGIALGWGAEPAAAQVQHRFEGGLELASVYDSNINRNRVDPQGLAGIVTTGILRYRRVGFYDLRAEYEVGLHQYEEDTPWNRVSHKLRTDGRRPVGRYGTLGLVSELQIRGSGEDRSLGNQLSIEPSFRLQPRSGTELRLRGVSRIRRNDAPAEGETNLFASLDVAQDLGSRTEVEVEFRFERNRSESGRRSFQGPRYEMALTRDLSPESELRLGLQWRERQYLERLIDTAEGDEALRRDTRLTPRIRWRRSVGDLVRITLDYEYEMRRSNDPDKVLAGHQVILGARLLR